jgi:hypothetical protein
MEKDKNNRSEPQKPKSQGFLDQYAWLGFPMIFLVWFGYGFLQGESPKDPSYDRLNTLFSGLAFWGVIWAILLQKSELILQREELQMTRQEVHGQKVELAAQNLTLRQQRFENTFFSLLNLFSGIISSMEIIDSRSSFKGRDCFTLLYSELQREYVNIQHNTPSTDYKASCIAAYDAFANYRQVVVGHYFRTFYNIVKFVDRSPIEDKQTYINILRAQLSSSELNLLFYNCLSNYGSEKFTHYVERFGLLENMMLSNLIRHDHKCLYKESAFKSQL